ncbi:MAG: Stf0 family sulfotransferase, partial [Pseudomonadota bacterium]
DKGEQAVSKVRADQTGLWHVAPDGSELERLAPHRDPVYDAAALKAAYYEAVECDAAWARWFTAEGLSPLRLTYEDLAADPAAALRAVLDGLGLDAAHADGVLPGTAKLADEISADWARRLRADIEKGRAR